MNNSVQLLKKAQADLQAGKPAKAEKNCRKLLKDKSLYLPVRLLLAKALTQQGNFKDAARFTAEAAAHEPANIQLQLAAGDMYFSLGQHRDAQPFLERAIGAQPANQDGWFKLLSCMAVDYITVRLDIATPEDPMRPPVPADLLALSKKISLTFPDNLKLVTIAGEIILASGNISEAETYFRRALAERPIIEAAHHNWLKIHHESFAFDAILDYQKQHGDAVAEDALCQRTIAYAFENTGQFDIAMDYLDRAVALCAEDKHRRNEFMAARGRVLGFLGRFEESLDALNEVLEINPGYLDAQHNRCLTYKCLGDIANAAKDEFARLEIENKHTKFQFEKPIWKGEPLKDKRLFIWSDMGIGDCFKYAPLLLELPKDAKIIMSVQDKMIPFLKVVLPSVEIRALPTRFIKQRNNRLSMNPEMEKKEGISTFEKIEEDFDFHMPLAALYTVLRPDMASFKRLTRSFALPEHILAPFRKLKCLGNKETVKVGLAWSSINRNAIVERNYLPVEDLLPIMRMPGFEFYNFQYSVKEEEIREFAEKHSVPLYHAPGLDLMDDMLGTAAFNSLMDLFLSPASTCSDIAGVMGIKSLRADLIHLPENLGQDHTPWYVDQKNVQIPWGKTIRDYMPEMTDWLVANKNYRNPLNISN